MSSSSSISLVVTDLDGTFWHTDDRIDPAVVKAVQELDHLGVPFLVATGRRLTSTRDPLARVGIVPPAVMLNGALGVDLATGDRFHRAPFPQDQAGEVLAAFQSVDLQPVVYVDHPEFEVYLAEQPSTHPFHAASFATTAAVGDLTEAVEHEAVLGFSMIGVDPAAAEAARVAIGELAEPHLDRSIDYVGMASFTVAPRHQSKWDGVVAFCRRHDLDPTRVLSLADGPNDLELLDESAVRLVPEVAHPEALARADHIIPAAADGGWVRVLDHLEI